MLEDQLKEFSRKLSSPKIAISNYEINSKWNRMFSIDLSNLDDIKIDATKVAHGGGDPENFPKQRNFKSKLVHCKNRTKDQRTIESRVRRGKRLPRISEKRQKAIVNKQTMPGFYLIGQPRYNSAKGSDQASRYDKHGYLTKGWRKICPDGSKVSHQKVKGKSYYRRICTPRRGQFNELKLIGLSPSNVHAFSEGTVMHGANYNQPADSGGTTVGTSKGCPAFYEGDFQRFSNQMKGTDTSSSLYYSYAPQCEKSQQDKGTYVEKLLEMKSKVIDEKETIELQIKVK